MTVQPQRLRHVVVLDGFLSAEGDDFHFRPSGQPIHNVIDGVNRTEMDVQFLSFYV